MSEGFSDSHASDNQFQPPPSKSGVGTCLIVCTALLLVGMLVCGGVAYYVYSNAKNMGAELARQGLTEAIQKSDLKDADKQVIIGEIDRVTDAFKSGEIGMEEVGRIMTELAESPLIAVMMVYAAEEKYIQPSGLSDEEKADASIVLSRVARGVVEKSIPEGALDEALDHVSHTNAEGQREFDEFVSDEDLREFISECKSQADAAGVPDERYQVDIGLEFRRAIDDALADK